MNWRWPSTAEICSHRQTIIRQLYFNGLTNPQVPWPVSWHRRNRYHIFVPRSWQHGSCLCVLQITLHVSTYWRVRRDGNSWAP